MSEYIYLTRTRSVSCSANDEATFKVLKADFKQSLCENEGDESQALLSLQLDNKVERLEYYADLKEVHAEFECEIVDVTDGYSSESPSSEMDPPKSYLFLKIYDDEVIDAQKFPCETIAKEVFSRHVLNALSGADVDEAMACGWFQMPCGTKLNLLVV